MKGPLIVHGDLSRLHPNRSSTGLTTRGIPLAKVGISHQKGSYINLANGIKLVYRPLRIQILPQTKRPRSNSSNASPTRTEYSRQ